LTSFPSDAVLNEFVAFFRRHLNVPHGHFIFHPPLFFPLMLRPLPFHGTCILPLRFDISFPLWSFFFKRTLPPRLRAPVPPQLNQGLTFCLLSGSIFDRLLLCYLISVLDEILILPSPLLTPAYKCVRGWGSFRLRFLSKFSFTLCFLSFLKPSQPATYKKPSRCRVSPPPNPIVLRFFISSFVPRFCFFRSIPSYARCAPPGRRLKKADWV